MRLLGTLALLASPLAAEQQTLDYSDFSAIEVKEGVAAYVQVGPVFTVTAIAPDGGLEGLKVQKFGQWLVLSRDSRWWFLPNGRDERLEVVITMPALTEIKALDRAAVTVAGGSGETLRAEASDNGHLILNNIDYDATTLVIENEGRLTANGFCDDFAYFGETPEPDAPCTVDLGGTPGGVINVTLPEQEPEGDKP
jgi:hypothetical protein